MDNIDVGWIQTLSVIVSMIISVLTAVYIFHKLTKSEINVIRESISVMNRIHREDTKDIGDRITRLEEKWDTRFEKMEEKWSNLFERLYFKENPPKKS